MPFGLCNVPATFQRMMNDILRDFLHKFVTVYLDDVCIYIRTLEEHLEHMRLVLQRFKEEGLKLRLKKCFFGLHEMEYLAILCQQVKFRFPQRKSRPLQAGQCPKRRRRIAVSYSFATSTPDLFITLATLRLH
jgi:small nuclear ribonucleoprotein (snRNP)-like protein